MQILELDVQCGGNLFHSLNGFFGTNNQSRAEQSIAKSYILISLRF